MVGESKDLIKSMDGSSKLWRYCHSSERYWSNVSSSIPCNGKLRFEGLHSCNSLPVVVLQKVACQKMLSLDRLNGKQIFTEISIFVLIPKIEMLLYHLVVVEACSMMSTPRKSLDDEETCSHPSPSVCPVPLIKRGCQLSWHMQLCACLWNAPTISQKSVFFTFSERLPFSTFCKNVQPMSYAQPILEPRISISWLTIASAYFSLCLAQSEKNIWNNQ